MRVTVRWLGFHDNCHHESDVFETEKEVKDFIRNLGEPEDQTAFLFNVDTRKHVSFYEFYKGGNNET